MGNLTKALCATVKFSDEEIETLEKHFKTISVPKNTELIKENELCGALWFINSGCVALKYKSGGIERILQVFTEHCFAMDIYSFLSLKPDHVTMQSLSECDLVKLSKEDVDELQVTMPHWKEFMQNLIKDACLFYALELLAIKSSTNEKRYFKLQNEQPELFQQVPLRTIANYLGITAVGLSKMRGRMLRLAKDSKQ